MYAIVEILGQQFKVVKDQKIFVHRLDEKEGSEVSFEKVLLLDDGKDIKVGSPTIKGVSIDAKIINTQTLIKGSAPVAKIAGIPA